MIGRNFELAASGGDQNKNMKDKRKMCSAHRGLSEPLVGINSGILKMRWILRMFVPPYILPTCKIIFSAYTISNDKQGGLLKMSEYVCGRP